jgi:hypothetical protein
MGIRDRPIAPRSPRKNGYAERLIGSIRRGCLDHVIVFGERHLRKLLRPIRSITTKPALTYRYAKTRRFLVPKILASTERSHRTR